MDSAPWHAAIRFGLGPRLGEPLPADPARWLRAQLAGPDPALDTAEPGVAEALAAIREDRKQPRDPGTPSRRAELVRAQHATLMDGLATTKTPLRERLVWFWANHFTVSSKRAEAALLAPYLREAIRPHVTGRFVDMLLAVMTHPAMLFYLDNVHSVGPASPAGLRAAGKHGRTGLNENLARECLELHTVGVAAGYDQADVTAFARVLTGWSVEMEQAEPGFLFRDDAHEPGATTVMGRVFPPGMAGGVAALTWLADHPATHRRLATGLVRHFVADQPPPDAVRRVFAVLRDSGGHLGAAAAAVIDLPAAWTPLVKLRTPADYVVACVRALDLDPPHRADMAHWMGQLGEGLFQAPLPNGFADTAEAWTGGEALLRRVDFAWSRAGKASDRDSAAVLEATLGPLAGAATVDAVRRAGSRREALTLLLAGPDFQRR